MTQTDYAQTQSQKESLTAGGSEDETVTGLLLRSALVAGWPGLIVDAYDAAGNKLDALRTERLSDSVLLCLFDGEVSRAELHQRPEMTHFGLDTSDDPANTVYSKKLRDAQGVEAGPTISSGAWLNTETRVVDVDALVSAIDSALKKKAEDEKKKTGYETFTSAQLALQMIEGVKRVTLYAKGAAT